MNKEELQEEYLEAKEQAEYWRGMLNTTGLFSSHTRAECLPTYLKYKARMEGLKELLDIK